MRKKENDRGRECESKIKRERARASAHSCVHALCSVMHCAQQENETLTQREGEGGREAKRQGPAER